MPPKDPAPTEDLLQIQIAIELDRGRKVAEIASEFQVPEKKVRNIARNAGLLESKKSSSARKRLSEEEKEVYREKSRTVRDARRTLLKDHT